MKHKTTIHQGAEILARKFAAAQIKINEVQTRIQKLTQTLQQLDQRVKALEPDYFTLLAMRGNGAAEIFAAEIVRLNQ